MIFGSVRCSVRKFQLQVSYVACRQRPPKELPKAWTCATVVLYQFNMAALVIKNLNWYLEWLSTAMWFTKKVLDHSLGPCSGTSSFLACNIQNWICGSCHDAFYPDIVVWLFHGYYCWFFNGYTIKKRSKARLLRAHFLLALDIKFIFNNTWTFWSILNRFR